MSRVRVYFIWQRRSLGPLDTDEFTDYGVPQVNVGQAGDSFFVGACIFLQWMIRANAIGATVAVEATQWGVVKQIYRY